MRTPRLRTMREFAESEIVLPTGDWEGSRFKVARNPFSGLLFDEMDSNRWRRLFITGPQRSGKTVCGSILPVMYHLFECRETVIYGVPTLDMVADKWKEDLLPAIERSKYKDLLPDSGPGSRGGNVRRVTFKNGKTLRFMTGGGGDKARAGFDSRVLVVTETDGFDEVGGTSREADKFSQLEGRVRGRQNWRVYAECTVSTEQGRTWREYEGGSASRIVIRCPKCKKYVTPERGQLFGWQGALDILEAGDKAHVCCPGCGEIWSEEDRGTANADCLLLHKGQEAADDGTIVGLAPRTDTLGFRYTAINNLLRKASDVAQEEWRAAREPDEEEAEKKMRQWVWALPHLPDKVDVTQLDAAVIARRVTTDERGRIPTACRTLTVGIDIGKRLCHWTASGFDDDAAPHVVDYGRLEVASDEMGTERALLVALRDFRDSVLEKGWESDEGPKIPDGVLIDAGWKGEESEDLQEVIDAFCRESNERCGETRYLPSMGWGAGKYRHPPAKDKRVRELGEQYHGAKVKGRSVMLLHVNADHWKTKVHLRLRTPLSQAGAMTLFSVGGDSREHTSFSKHLVAERQEEIFVPGRGRTIRFRMFSRINHWLDATMLSLVAAHRAGARVVTMSREVARPAAANAAHAAATTPPRDAAAMGRTRTSWFAGRKKRS